MVPAGNKAERLSSVNHSTKILHHHHQHQAQPELNKPVRLKLSFQRHDESVFFDQDSTQFSKVSLYPPADKYSLSRLLREKD